MKFLGFVQRIKQRQARQQTLNQFAKAFCLSSERQNRVCLTEVDLADMGLKRYQLEANLQG
jgi:hypothetical protein